MPGLRGIAEDGDGWRIGALATWTDLDPRRAAAAVRRAEAAAREVGGVQIQNRGTLAGNICTASPAGDGMPNLLALDARWSLRACRAAASCRCAASSTAIATPCRGTTRSSPPSWCRSRRARRRAAISSSSARAAIWSSPSSWRPASSRPMRRASSPPRASPSAPARPSPQRLPALEAALIGQPPAAAADLVCADASRAACADRRHPRLGRLSPAGGARARRATCWPAVRNPSDGGPPDAGHGPRSPAAGTTVSFTLNGEPATVAAPPFASLADTLRERARPHRHQDRLRGRRLRRLHRAPRRRAGLRLPGATAQAEGARIDTVEGAGPAGSPSGCARRSWRTARRSAASARPAC